MTALRIFHFSDIHAGGGPEDAMAFLDKRWVGAFNYTFRRRFKHDLSILSDFVSGVLKEKPDLLVCTGDLTSTGQPGEFAQTMRLLKPLVKARIPMIFVPGNHDCYVTRTRCVRAVNKVFSRLNAAFGLELSTLPQKRIFRGAEFWIVNESWPSNLISSCGYLKPHAQRVLKGFAEEPVTMPRLMVGHYPLAEEHPWLRIRHRLWGEGAVLPMLESGILDFSLCGHVHQPSLKKVGEGMEVCAGSLTRNRCFAEMNLTDGKWSVRHMNILPGGLFMPADKPLEVYDEC